MWPLKKIFSEILRRENFSFILLTKEKKNRDGWNGNDEEDDNDEDDHVLDVYNDEIYDDIWVRYPLFSTTKYFSSSVNGFQTEKE